MNRETFNELPFEKKAAIANYMQSLTGLKRQRIVLVATGAAIITPMLLPDVVGPSDSSNFKGPPFLLSAVEFLLSPSLIVATALIMIVIAVVLSWKTFKDFFSSRSEMLGLGISTKDIRGLTEDDIIYLFIIPQLRKQGYKISED